MGNKSSHSDIKLDDNVGKAELLLNYASSIIQHSTEYKNERIKNTYTVAVLKQYNNHYNRDLINNPIQFEFNDNSYNCDYYDELKPLLIECQLLKNLPIDILNIIYDYTILNKYILINGFYYWQRLLISINPIHVNAIVDFSELNRFMLEQSFINKLLSGKSNQYNNFFNTIITTELIKSITFLTQNIMNKTICYYKLLLHNNYKLLLQFNRPINHFTSTAIHINEPIYTIIDNQHIALFTGFSIEIYNINNYIIENTNSNSSSAVNNNFSSTLHTLLTNQPKSDSESNESNSNSNANDPLRIVPTILTLITPFLIATKQSAIIPGLIFNKNTNILVFSIQGYAIFYNICNGQLLNIVSLHKNKVCSNIISKNNEILYLEIDKTSKAIPSVFLNSIKLNDILKHYTTNNSSNNNKNNNNNSNNNNLINRKLLNYDYFSANGENTLTSIDIGSSTNKNHIILSSSVGCISIIDYVNGNTINTLCIKKFSASTLATNLLLNLNIKGINVNTNHNEYIVKNVISPFMCYKDKTYNNDDNNNSNNDHTNNDTKVNNNKDTDNSNVNTGNSCNIDGNSYLIGFLHNNARGSACYCTFIDLYSIPNGNTYSIDPLCTINLSKNQDLNSIRTPRAALTHFTAHRI